MHLTALCAACDGRRVRRQRTLAGKITGDGMNWDALSAVGQILGAGGVIATLIYLAIQVRQNSHQLERSIEATSRSAEDAVGRGFDLWREWLVTNPEVAQLFIRGMYDIEKLEESDRLRFNMILASFGWLAWQVGRAENLLGNTNAEILRHLLLYPGGRTWYRTHREFFPPDFRAAVDDLLAQLEREDTPYLRPEDASSMFSGVLREPGF